MLFQMVRQRPQEPHQPHHRAHPPSAMVFPGGLPEERGSGTREKKSQRGKRGR